MEADPSKHYKVKICNPSPPESRTKLLKEVEANPIKMGETIIEKVDSQTLKIKWQIVQRKIRQVRKTMDKKSTNLSKQALIQGQSMCNREDLLTECIMWWKKFVIRCVTLGIEKEQAGNLKLKKTIM